VVVTCTSCQKKYRLEDKHFVGRDHFQFKCPSCGQPIDARKPQAEGDAKPPATQPINKKVEATWTESDVPEAELLALPPGKRVSLAVLQGADSGLILAVDKPVVVIGRADADLVLGDSEVSRRHARLEFKGLNVQLRDLNSTNGTYVNEQRITVTPLDNQTEFRVGATTLMMIITDVEE
jgi:pSer/pThr/pTyr-binding forkhead associated (FHA) protein